MLAGTTGIRLRSLALLMREPGRRSPCSRATGSPPTSSARKAAPTCTACLLGAGGTVIDIALGDDNAIASFSVSAREPGEKNWG